MHDAMRSLVPLAGRDIFTSLSVGIRLSSHFDNVLGHCSSSGSCHPRLKCKGDGLVPMTAATWLRATLLFSVSHPMLDYFVLAHSAPRRFAVLASALLLTSLNACATASMASRAEPIITDRPDFTESAVTVATGLTQIEAGQTFTREASTNSMAVGELLVRRGLARRVELRVAVNSYTIESHGDTRARGFEDAGIGAKISLMDAGEGARRWQPALAAIVGASVPTGASPYRSRHVLPEVKMLAAWDLTDRVAFSANGNWSASDDAIRIHNEWSGSASFGFSLTDKLGAYTEYYAFGENAGGWQRRQFVNGGVTYQITHMFQLDARAGVGPSPSRRDYFAGLGFSRRW